MTQPGGLAKLMEEVDKDNIMILVEFRRGKRPNRRRQFCNGRTYYANAGVASKTMEFMKKFGMKALIKLQTNNKLKTLLKTQTRILSTDKP